MRQEFDIDDMYFKGYKVKYKGLGYTFNPGVLDKQVSVAIYPDTGNGWYQY